MSTSERDASHVLDHDERRGPLVPEMAEDLEMAAATDVPVLISGHPAPSLELACDLCRRAGSPDAGIVLIDCRRASADRISSVIAESMQLAAGRTRALLLLEVHALGPDSQDLLEHRLETALLHRRNTGLRVIASSSVSLFGPVVEGLFRERLYYLLNMIHIVLPAQPRAQG